MDDFGVNFQEVIWVNTDVRDDNRVEVDLDGLIVLLSKHDLTRYSDVNPAKKGLSVKIVRNVLNSLCHNKLIRCVFISEEPRNMFNMANTVSLKSGRTLKGFMTVESLNRHVIKHVLGFGVFSNKKDLQKNQNHAKSVYEQVYKNRLERLVPYKLEDWDVYNKRLSSFETPDLIDYLNKGSGGRKRCRRPRVAAHIRTLISDLSEAYEAWIVDILQRGFSGKDPTTGYVCIERRRARQEIIVWANNTDLVILDGKTSRVVTSFSILENIRSQDKAYKHLQRFIARKILRHDVIRSEFHMPQGARLQ